MGREREGEGSKRETEKREEWGARERVWLPSIAANYVGRKGMRDQIFTTPHLLYSPFKSSNYCLPSWRGAVMALHFPLESNREDAKKPHCRNYLLSPPPPFDVWRSYGKWGLKRTLLARHRLHVEE